MSEFTPITFSDEFINKYWSGPSNVFVRYFNYLQRGFSMVNEAKNYILLIFGSLWTARVITFFGWTIHSSWIFIAGLLGVPVLVIAGRWDLFRASKAREFLTVVHGSITGYKSFNMSVRITEQNDEIIGLLKQLLNK